MWYQVSREGESFGELWPKAINALINSNDPLVEKYNLKEQDFQPAKADLIMAQKLIQSAEANKGTYKGRLAKDLQAIQRWYGIEFFAHNPNLMRRLYTLIAEDSPIDTLAQKQAKVDSELSKKKTEFNTESDFAIPNLEVDLNSLPNLDQVEFNPNTEL